MTNAERIEVGASGESIRGPDDDRTLSRFLTDAARLRPDHSAVEELAGGRVTYRELNALAAQVAAMLALAGVCPGDRVAICLPKSINAVAAIFGVLRAGAAYVPVDVDSPAWRAAYIFRDCGVRVAFVSAERKQELASALASPAEFGGPSPHLIAVRSAPSGEGIRALLPKVTPSMQGDAGPARADDLAYVLYTSGSTGQPKGVVLPHRAGTSFIDWCSTAFNVREDDRFSSHAPFHFDLSILDLFLPIRHTATVVLFDAAASKEPVALARSIATHRISIWYSTPSILTMLAYYGKLSDHEYPALRTVLFAGEVFPVKHLRALKQIWTTPGFYNLYGPTETNVCTWHMIPDVIPAERSEPYPIGALCAHCRGRISDETGAQATRGEEGELCIAGPAVMNGYWNQQALTDAAIRMDADGTRWYRTGDVVVDDGSGILTFVGRRDRMIKRRGYRIELGEIETMLHRYPRVEGVAAVAHRDANGELRIVACLHCAGEPPGTIAMKQWCAEAMPAYMIPDRFLFLDALPTTSTDKIDYQRLLAMV